MATLICFASLIIDQVLYLRNAPNIALQGKRIKIYLTPRPLSANSEGESEDSESPSPFAERDLG